MSITRAQLERARSVLAMRPLIDTYFVVLTPEEHEAATKAGILPLDSRTRVIVQSSPSV